MSVFSWNMKPNSYAPTLETQDFARFFSYVLCLFYGLKHEAILLAKHLISDEIISLWL